MYVEKRKLAILKHCLGVEGRKVLKTLPLQGVQGEDSDQEEEVYENAVKALEENYGKKKNFVVERHKFFSCTQKQGETIDQYVSNLRRLAISCKFKDLNDEIFRGQLINRLRDMKIQEKLLGLKSPTLEKTVEVAKHMEITQQYVKELNSTDAGSKEQNTVSEVKFIRRNVNEGCGKKKECYRCGSNKHLAEAKNCPAVNIKCFKCKKIVHFARVCRMIGDNKFKKSVNAVKEGGIASKMRDDSASEEELEVMTVMTVEEEEARVCIQQNVKKKEYKPPKCIVEINERQLHMWADSCSPFTLIDERVWENLGENKLNPTDVVPEGYCGGKLPILGYFEAELAFKNRKTIGKIYVVRQGKSLLGWKEQRALGIILDPNHPEQVLLTEESRKEKWV
ncbi:hypothetical protein NDU88_001808 [Pleurodeles waltl]|uniref:CCHC-type domain-containing protein n=1 Tax=Pleurodeles waltl TaxID=8319 RepID=A0AAV7WMV5_PLEWA|nr:hypothetical protein NDU88_001808 [Pleurodeles waltl]